MQLVHEARLAWRLVRRARPGDVGDLLFVVLGVAVATFALLLGGSVPVVIQAQAQARGDRAPLIADGTPGHRELTGSETVGGAPYTRVTVVGARPESPVPPGVSVWPKVGASLVSPRLRAAIDDDPGLSTQLGLGRVVGEIGAAGLTGPDELRSYTTIPGPPAADGVSGYGRPDVTGMATPGSMLVLELGSLVLVPSLLLLMMCLRVTGRRRCERYTSWVVLGVTPARCARVFAVEIVLLAVAGSALGRAYWRVGASLLVRVAWSR